MRRRRTRSTPSSRHATTPGKNTVERRWREIRKGTGLEWVTPHTFRKTVATLISARVRTSATFGATGAMSERVAMPTSRSRRRGQTLRPSLPDPNAEDLGYLLGRACGQEICASVEDSILIVGPPRSGKGLHLVINAILEAPGSVVTTSTRPANITATLRAREA